MAAKDLHPNEYILFVWGIYKRPEHYSGVGYKNLHSECIRRKDNKAHWKTDLPIAEKRAKELISEYSKDKSTYLDFEVVIKGDDSVEYGRF